MLRLKFHPANIPSRFVSPRAAQRGLARENREQLDTKPSLRAPVPPEHPGIHPGRYPRAGEERNLGFFTVEKHRLRKCWDGEGWERMGMLERDGKEEIVPSSSGERL